MLRVLRYASCMAKKKHYLKRGTGDKPAGAVACEMVMVRSPYADYPIAKVCKRGDGTWGHTSPTSPATLYGRKRTKLLAVKGAISRYRSWIG